MNVRKPIDYNTLYRKLDVLVEAGLPQMKLYCEIGKLVSARPEKGAAVATAEYFSRTYPDASGFSPRNLRRMRDFYRTYESFPEILAEAMTIGWTQNVVILENCENLEERVWYIRAARQFSWTKAEMLEKIHDEAYLENSLDVATEECYTETNFEDCSSVAERPAEGSVCSGLTGEAYRTLPCNGQPSRTDHCGSGNNTLSTVHKREGSIPILPVKRQRNSWGNNGQYSFWQVSSEQYGIGPSAAKPTSDIMVSAVAKGSPSAVEKLKGIFTANFLPCKMKGPRISGIFIEKRGSSCALSPGTQGFSIFARLQGVPEKH